MAKGSLIRSEIWPTFRVESIIFYSFRIFTLLIFLYYSPSTMEFLLLNDLTRAPYFSSKLDQIMITILCILIDNSKNLSEDLFAGQDSIFSRIRGSLQDFLGKKDNSLSEMNVGEFRATVERLAGGKEIIRIAHREEAPATQNSRIKASSVNQNLLFSFKEVMKESIKNGNGDAEVPGWLLRMYHKLGMNGDESSAQEQTKWLLAQLRDLSLEDDESSNSDNQRENIKKVSDISKRDKIEKTVVDGITFADLSSRVPSDNSETTSQFTESNVSNLDPAPSKFLYILDYQLMKTDLNEKLVKLKMLLEKQPKGWQKVYFNELSEVKSVLHKIEHFPQKLYEDELSNLESGLSEEKIREFKLLLKSRQEKLQLFKFAVSQLEHVSKVIFLAGDSINDNSAISKSSNDDIIISYNKFEESERTSKSERKKNDEL